MQHRQSCQNGKLQEEEGKEGEGVAQTTLAALSTEIKAAISNVLLGKPLIEPT